MSELNIFSATEVAMYYATQVPRLQQRGQQWRGICPLHRGKHLSLSVNPETGCWYCFSDCGRGGSLIDFEMEFTGADFRTALNAVCNIIGRPWPDSQWNAVHYYKDRDKRRADERDQRDAAYFASAARLVMEGELERLPFDSPERRIWTQLLLAIGLDAQEILRRLKRVDLKSAEAWVTAGRRHQQRIQMRLVQFVLQVSPEDSSHAA